MFIPISSDAPLYYRPIGTATLIGLNIAAFTHTDWGDSPGGYLLRFGDGLHPTEWVLSAFLHFGFGHLIGNMIFLWAFGLIVEGKLGWQRFLPLYLGICLGEGAVDQLLMLFYDGPTRGAGGASGAIFGLMAIALLWGPENSLEVVYAYGFGFGLMRTGTFDVKVSHLAVYYLASNLLFAWLKGFAMSSELLHLVGAGVGAGFGVLLLQQNWVDCEGWDWFSVRRGDHRHRPGEAVPLSAWKVSTDEHVLRHFNRTPRQNGRRLREALDASQFVTAGALYLRERPRGRIAPLSQAELQTLIDGLVQHREWTLAAPLLEEHLTRFPEQSTAARLTLACLYARELHRPRAALEQLDRLIGEALTAKQRNLAASARRMAQQQVDDGLLELAATPTGIE